MTNIDVASIAGEHCITAEDGEVLYARIRAALEQGEIIILDFSRTSVFASPFFNAAIGPLLQNHSSDELNRQVVPSNLSADGITVLRRVIRNAREYYTDERIRKAVDEIADDESK